MSQSVIVSYFRNNSDERGIPKIKYEDWVKFISEHSKEDIKNALADYISDNNIPFPSRQYSKREFESAFIDFVQTSMLKEFKHFPNVMEKYDYKNKYSDKPLGVIDKSHVYNIISNYFQQENRMQCGSLFNNSPYSIWNDRDRLKTMNWQFWRLGVLEERDIDDQLFREAFRIGTYTATQFRPNVAKALYEKHKAENVVDTSSGWGDRLAGFYGTHCTKVYVGCDPNPKVYEQYKKQCVEYERILGHTATLTEYADHFTCVGSKSVKIYNLPSEDVDWSKHKNQFDFYFTSPPYFETERYGVEHSETQSWFRYKTFNEWKNDFFFKVNRMIWDTLKDDAFMMINIIEPISKGSTRLNLCDDMVDDICSYPTAHYLGKIGMRMVARPHKIIDEDNYCIIEPVWVFRKNNSEYLKESWVKFFEFN